MQKHWTLHNQAGVCCGACVSSCQMSGGTNLSMSFSQGGRVSGSPLGFACVKPEALYSQTRRVSDIIDHFIRAECKQGWVGKLLPLQASAVQQESNLSQNSSTMAVDVSLDFSGKITGK